MRTRRAARPGRWMLFAWRQTMRNLISKKIFARGERRISPVSRSKECRRWRVPRVSPPSSCRAGAAPSKAPRSNDRHPRSPRTFRPRRAISSLGLQSSSEWRRGGEHDSSIMGRRAWRRNVRQRLELPGAADNAATAAWLWGLREPISEDCPAGLYLRRTRGYHGPIPPTLGYLPANGKHPPAMIAAFGFCEEPEPALIAPPAIVTGIHLTRLTRRSMTGSGLRSQRGSRTGSLFLKKPAWAFGRLARPAICQRLPRRSRPMSSAPRFSRTAMKECGLQKRPPG
jgi:hypothetical protein